MIHLEPLSFYGMCNQSGQKPRNKRRRNKQLQYVICTEFITTVRMKEKTDASVLVVNDSYVANMQNTQLGRRKLCEGSNENDIKGM
jgi:hypothetical protein